MQTEFTYRRPPRWGRRSWWKPRQFQLQGPTGDHILEQVRHKSQFYELDLLEAIDQALPLNARCIVDVGANVGNHSLYFAAVMQAQVVAVEPGAEALAFLRTNLADNDVLDRVQVHPLALSSRVGTAHLARGPNGNLGMSRLVECASSGLATAVATTTLDALIDAADLRAISAIKIDVEGHEVEVLGGALDTLRRFQPLLIVEACDPPALQALESLLWPLGYRQRARYCATPTFLFSRDPLRRVSLLERLAHRGVRRLGRRVKAETNRDE